VLCHNSLPQLENIGRLRQAIAEMLRVTKPGGYVVIADYQRSNSLAFKNALSQRLAETRPEIVQLLLDTFLAAWSKEEFESVISSLEAADEFQIEEARLPSITPAMFMRMIEDPVLGHVMDRSPISQLIIIRKQ
jgi:ubiquinone/menaquinone biosynthesis C-methylase UbiE